MTDANARRCRKRDRRGGNRQRKERGRRGFEDRSLTLLPGLRLAFIPAGTKTASPALPALPLNPHQHALAVSHPHTQQGGIYIRTHTHAGFCIIKEKKNPGRRRRRWGREMINKWPIICSVTQLSNRYTDHISTYRQQLFCCELKQ